MAHRRLFIAVELSIAVVEQLMAAQDELQRRIERARVRWVHPENIHLPLKYLGPVDEALIGLVRQRIEAMVAPLFPFQAECTHLGCHPDPRRPRIIWAGLDPESGEVITLLKRTLARELDELGLPPDPRPFHARLTLGRVRSRQRPDFTELLEDLQESSYGVSTLKDLILFSAELHPRNGPHYRVIDRFAL